MGWIAAPVNLVEAVGACYLWLQERAQGSPVGAVHKKPADPDADLSLAGSGQRDDDLDVNILGSCGMKQEPDDGPEQQDWDQCL